MVATVGAIRSVADALSVTRSRGQVLYGQLERNQGRPTFSGRLSLDQLAELTVVHNRDWAEGAGQTLEIVTQRELVPSHVAGLVKFILQGLVHATMARISELGATEVLEKLETIQSQIGSSAHYGLPSMTFVLAGDPEVEPGTDAAMTKMFLPTGTLFLVADGQHRREAAREVRMMLNEILTTRHLPRQGMRWFADLYAGPYEGRMMDAWVAIQDTFKTWTFVVYEAHLGLGVAEARQLFINCNYYGKPVNASLSLEFDTSNPINLFGKELQETINEDLPLDLRQLAAINGFLFLGRASIRRSPAILKQEQRDKGTEFWTALREAKDWSREGTLMKQIPILKAFARMWYLTHFGARGEDVQKVHDYISKTRFDLKWLKKVPGLSEHAVVTDGEMVRFSPAHNDIVRKIQWSVLGEAEKTLKGSKPRG